MEFGLDHLQYMQEHTGIALHSTRHTWRMVEAVPMPMFVAPQIQCPDHCKVYAIPRLPSCSHKWGQHCLGKQSNKASDI